MVRTFHIAGILIAFAAVFVLVFSFFYGEDRSGEIQEILQNRAIEAFFAKEGRITAKVDVENTSFVQQALQFANYLDPPKAAPVARKRPEPTRSRRPSRPTPAVASVATSRYSLSGTSFNASKPDFSLALIDVPGTGMRWYREGDSVDRESVTVAKIEEGKVTLSDGRKQFELIAQQVERVNLLKGAGGDSQIESGVQPSFERISRPSQPVAAAEPKPRNTKKEPAPVSVSYEEPDPQKVLDKLQKLRSSIDADDARAQEALDKIMEKMVAATVDPNEAENLDKLGEVLQESSPPSPPATMPQHNPQDDIRKAMERLKNRRSR